MAKIIPYISSLMNGIAESTQLQIELSRKQEKREKKYKDAGLGQWACSKRNNAK